MLERYIPTLPTIVGEGLCINLYPCMFKFCESSCLSLTSLKQITLGKNGRVSNNSFSSWWCLFREVILRCIKIKELLEQKLRGNTLQSSKRQGAKFEYITSVVLSSNLSALLLLSKMLVNRVRLFKARQHLKLLSKKWFKIKISCKRQRLLKQVQLVPS